VGVPAFDAVTQVAGAAPPPVVNTDYASYPPAGAVPATCTGGAGGPAVLTGYRAYFDPTNVDPARRAANPTVFADPFDTGVTPGLGRVEGLIQSGDLVVIRWTDWAAGCDSLTISFPLKATTEDHFDLADDQALVREPNGAYVFPFCNAATDPCLNPGQPGGGSRLTTVVPQLNIVWVGTGTAAPSNLPDGVTLTVTSSASDVDPTVISTAMCTFPGGVFTCDYRDAADPSVPQGGGLLVTNNSLLTVTESAFDGNVVDPPATLPVGVASKYVGCQGISGPCVLTVTNTPPPPPPPPPTTASPETIPNTLPATGSSDSTPIVFIALLMIPVGVVMAARRRATHR
jgi:hypothetical protein